MSDAPRRKHRRLRRTWPQRLLLTLNLVVVLACVGAAAGLRYAVDKAAQTKRVTMPQRA